MIPVAAITPPLPGHPRTHVRTPLVHPATHHTRAALRLPLRGVASALDATLPPSRPGLPSFADPDLPGPPRWPSVGRVADCWGRQLAHWHRLPADRAWDIDFTGNTSIKIDEPHFTRSCRRACWPRRRCTTDTLLFLTQRVIAGASGPPRATAATELVPTTTRDVVAPADDFDEIPAFPTADEAVPRCAHLERHVFPVPICRSQVLILAAGHAWVGSAAVGAQLKSTATARKPARADGVKVIEG
jgi:hypothetical protein